jgi:hypothetical protein
MSLTYTRVSHADKVVCRLDAVFHASRRTSSPAKP